MKLEIYQHAVQFALIHCSLDLSDKSCKKQINDISKYNTCKLEPETPCSLDYEEGIVVFEDNSKIVKAFYGDWKQRSQRMSGGIIDYKYNFTPINEVQIIKIVNSAGFFEERYLFFTDFDIKKIC